MEEKCPYCGETLINGKCQSCGYYDKDYVVEERNPREYTIHIDVSSKAQSRSNRWVAFGLCFFLGVLGAHYFYVGRIGKGVLYLFTGGLFGIGWIVDLIKIAEGSFQDEFGKYLY